MPRRTCQREENKEITERCQKKVKLHNRLKMLEREKQRAYSKKKEDIWQENSRNRAEIIDYKRGER